MNISNPKPRVQISKRKKIKFVALLTLLVVVLLELLLHGLCALSESVANLLEPPHSVPTKPTDDSSIVEDAVLEHRPRPDYRDHDARGFRNPKALNQAEIVCLGDSQTYGAGVERDEAGPHQLAKISNRSVYSLSYGGWGPTHSQALLPEALELQPKLIIEAIYSGNDLWDCYSMVYERRQSLSHLIDEPELQTQIEVANQRRSLQETITEQYRFYLGDFGPPSEEMTPLVEPEVVQNSSGLRSWLSRNSRIYGVGRAVKQRFSSARNARYELINYMTTDDWDLLQTKTESSGGHWEAFESGSIRTIFVPNYRFLGLNLDDPRIRAGLQIATGAILEMDRQLQKTEIQFLVILIPTKELVFAEIYSMPSSAFSNLVEEEMKMWQITRRTLDTAGVPYLDLLPALRDALDEGRQPYKINTDGHPNAVGHRVISEQVDAWIDNFLR